MKKVLRNNGLSLVLGLVFVFLWAAQAIAGWQFHNGEEKRHGQPQTSLSQYLRSGHFWQATGENWESEFLQMGAYIVLTSFLFQKGSAESNDPDEPAQPERPQPPRGWLYRYSLSLAFGLLFLVSFVLHAWAGLRESNSEIAAHGGEPQTMSAFLKGPEFWFQSFQNWQSEFLAVLSIVVLSIFLRHQGSPESKPVDAPDSKTGA